MRLEFDAILKRFYPQNSDTIGWREGDKIVIWCRGWTYVEVFESAPGQRIGVIISNDYTSVPDFEDVI